ncbi:uncharacterized protein [Miscanthus floridulus]|uniref:uncharacterized protein n=1 Tax=Miscanthus floridulus TaxID=154761 RepID=UPI0034578560
MKLWIRHVLMCKVQVLSLDIRRINNGWDPWLGLGNLPLVSQNVKRLKLGCVQLNDSFLDFSSCLALEVLEFDCCQFLDCHRISSQSLKFLSFRNQFDYERISRTHIYAPNLISLWLEASDGWIPLLERMPSMVEAVVKIKFSDDSYCLDCEDEDCSCYPVHGDTVGTMVLQGLSEAQSLVLWSDIREVYSCLQSIFSRDLKCCPIFTNLKTLSLNEYWCMPGEFSSLTCILEHSPVLEKPTLQLFCKEPKSKVEMRGSPDTTERSNAISEHFKKVDVKCEVVDEKVLNVLEFLSKHSIYDGNRGSI